MVFLAALPEILGIGAEAGEAGGLAGTLGGIGRAASVAHGAEVVTKPVRNAVRDFNDATTPQTTGSEGGVPVSSWG
jgi:hypothetical protein